MPQVDFYVLADPGDGAALHAACRVVEKAWGMGLTVHVQARDEDHAERMDQALWTFRQDSFVPHERWAGGDPPRTRVTVSAAGVAPRRTGPPGAGPSSAGQESDAEGLRTDPPDARPRSRVSSTG